MFAFVKVRKNPYHYYFELNRINIILDVEAGKTKKGLLKKTESHIIAKSEIIGLYKR